MIRGQEFLLHVVRAVFVNIENDNLFWFHLGQLPAELGADGAAAARDENDLVPIIRAGLFVGNMDRLAEEQILHVELAQMALLSGGLHDGVVIYLDLISGGGIAGVEVSLFLLAQVLNGENDFLHLKAAELLDGVLVLHHDGDAVDFAPGLFWVAIDKAARGIGRVRVSEELFGEVHAHAPGADDGDLDFLDGVDVDVHHVLTGKNAQQKAQKMPPGRILGAILKGISVDHPDGKRAEQIHAGDAQQARKGEPGDMRRHRQQKFDGEHGKKRSTVCNKQPDVALNAAVAPDLLIDASAGTGEKDADKADAAVQQNRAPAQMLAAPVQNQQQHIQRQQDQHIVSDQWPANPPSFHGSVSPSPARRVWACLLIHRSTALPETNGRTPR